MARLSLCVIARDEEELLPGLLDSVRGVVDEIVLVDTGSIDGTAALARAAGAKVLEQPWRHDFSAPRNLAVEHATGEWVLQLDADERLAPGAGEVIREALALAPFDLAFLRLHNADRLDAAPADVVAGRSRIGEPAHVPRLLRRTDGLRWDGVVHENVGAWFLRRGRRGEHLPADVIHLGGIAALRDARGKRTRNVALLRARAAAEPDDATPLGYLAMELFEGRADVSEAADAAERGWALRDAQPPHRALGRLGVARALIALKQGDADRAAESIAYVERRDGPSADLHFLSGCVAELRAAGRPLDDPDAVALLGRAVTAHLAALEAVRAARAEVVFVAVPATILIRLGTALRLLGRHGEAIAAFQTARELGPDALATWGEADARLAAGDPAGALAVLEPALDARPDGWAIAAAAALALGAAGDARVFLVESVRRAGAGFALAHVRARLPELDRALAHAAS